MNRIIKFLLLIILSMSAFTLHAQDANKVYNEGVALLNKAKAEKKSKSVRDSNCDEAIKKFKAAAIINTTFTKKCNTQINAANKLKKSAFKSGNEEPNTPTPPAHKFTVSKNKLKIDYEGKTTETINVETSGREWKAFVSEKDAEWCTVNQSEDGKSVTVQCKPVPSTMERTALLYVSCDNHKKEIKVVQAGQPLVMYVTKADGAFKKLAKKATTAVGIESVVEKISQVEFKKKGDSATLAMFCNSEQKYQNNGDCNWYVYDSPEWCKVILNAKENVKYQENEFKNKISLQTREFKVVVQGIEDKNSDDFKLGRKGDLVLKSQDQTVRITIYQNK